MLRPIHVALRAVGIVVVALLLVGGAVFYLSDEYDLMCNEQTRLERGRQDSRTTST